MSASEEAAMSESEQTTTPASEHSSDEDSPTPNTEVQERPHPKLYFVDHVLPPLETRTKALRREIRRLMQMQRSVHVQMARMVRSSEDLQVYISESIDQLPDGTDSIDRPYFRRMREALYDKFDSVDTMVGMLDQTSHLQRDIVKTGTRVTREIVEWVEDVSDNVVEEL
ncbi:hypothetical protein EJ06DRAFT_172431 [Trichodelitschia bisporula]|uniref:Uncharacterized protein n=1 Tax=Trichodelitschia bisporula TaxID=703511 RepID=A0A6G1HLR4_9PEZI|nr:hypothetical protein EJ06DRAFT_172431 [Trichodelitschia bisporula]